MSAASAMRSLPPAALIAAAVAILAPGDAFGAKATECSKIGICFCVDQDVKPVVETKVANFRAQIADQRKRDKAIGYLSVPLSPAGGGYMKLNIEIAQNAKSAVEKRFGADDVWVLNPGTAEANLPSTSGADYMLMWTSILEGPTGMGEDFDFVYFVGPQDFARFFEFDGNADMAKLDAYYDKRVKSDPEFEKETRAGLTRAKFRNYYALKASAAFSRGAHDEWNIIRVINERRRSDPKLGIANQLPMLFDGRATPSAGAELPVSDGYLGKCAP
jgi:hypothetical protein